MAGGMNPVAMGILTGSLSGAAMGFMVGGPVGAAVGLGIGASMGAATGSEQQKQLRAQDQMKRSLEKAGINNQNALVEEQFNKRKSALGLGDSQTSPMGNQASQTGAVLTSTTNGNSILG